MVKNPQQNKEVIDRLWIMSDAITRLREVKKREADNRNSRLTADKESESEQESQTFKKERRISVKTNDDIESYLIRAELDFEEVSDGMWLVRDQGGQVDLVIKHDPPVTVFRLKLVDLPEGDNAELFRELLELNASAMLHGSFGIEDNSLVLTEALEAENLDFNEFQASADSLLLASREHHQTLARFFPKKLIAEPTE